MDLRSRAGNGGNDGINNLLTTRRTNNEKPGNRIHPKHETALSFLRHRISTQRFMLSVSTKILRGSLTLFSSSEPFAVSSSLRKS